MKKFYYIFAFLLCVLFAFSCGGDGNSDISTDTDELKNKRTTIRVEYIAGEGGYIDGRASQAIETSYGNDVTFNGVRAVANQGYYFVKWSDGLEKSERIDTLSSASSFTAIFARAVEVKYTALEGGTIFGQSVQYVKPNETSSLVEARANYGYRFAGWSDGVTSEIREDNVSQSIEYFASFEKIQYCNINYKCETGGKIEGLATQNVEKGTSSQQIKAIPSKKGYYFVKWDDGVLTAERSDIVNDDVTLTAIFSNEHKIAYEATEGGYILGESAQSVIYGSHTSNVMAIANDGYVFVGWDDGTMGFARNDSVTGSVIYKAIFKLARSVSFSCDNERGVIVGEATQTVGDGEKAKTVRAVANDGYQFVCWSNGMTEPEIQVTAFGNLELYAHFSYASTGLPVVAIDTETGYDVTDNKEYIGCIISLFDTEKGEHFVEQTAQIRGRGNSTLERFSKNPYKIKFESKQDFFDNGKAKTWVLLADYRDYSLIRNLLAYEVGEEMSELYATPDCQSVEVYLNGKYHGVYLLCEQVEVKDHRVEVDEDATEDNTSFLVEMDGWTDEVQVYVPDNLNANRKYSVKFPDNDDITEGQKKFIEDYLKSCISAIQGDDYLLVTELIDVKSFAQAYIVFELFKNPDTNYSSLYFYKDKAGKLVCGPIWDFDMAVGNVSHKGDGVFESTQTLWSKEQCPWFNALLRYEEFVLLVGEELEDNASIIRATLEKEFEYVLAHADAYKKNFEKWDILGKQTWSNPEYLIKIITWEAHVEYVRNYLEQSLEYLEYVYCDKEK